MVAAHITFGNRQLAYGKYRNVSFELTDTAIKFRNGRLTRTINYRTIEWALCEMAMAYRDYDDWRKIAGGSLVISDMKILLL